MTNDDNKLDESLQIDNTADEVDVDEADDRVDAGKKIYGIVCGMQRCGTRNFASLLNKYRAFSVQGEMHVPLLRRALQLILDADDIFKNGNKDVPLIWLARRYDAIARATMIITKGNPMVRPVVRMHGFKLPNAEFESELLNQVLAPSVLRIQYMYCIRNPADCFLSLSAMPWFRRTPDQFIKVYIRSLKKISELKRAGDAGATPVGVSIFNLDSFIASRDKAEWVANKMFLPLGVERSRKTCARYLETMGYINSTVQATGQDRPKSLPGDVRAIFEENREPIARAISDFNETFQEELQFKLH